MSNFGEALIRFLVGGTSGTPTTVDDTTNLLPVVGPLTNTQLRATPVPITSSDDPLNFALEAAIGGLLTQAGDAIGTVNKFGRTTNADNGVATDIHDGADAGNVIWDAPTAARTHTVVSTSASDDGSPAGIGAQTVRVYGLTSWSTAESNELITMNGTTGVTTSASYVIIHRMVVEAYGTSGPNVGIITATATTDATITATILAGSGQTQMAIYGVPSTQTLYVTQMYASLLRATPSATNANVTLLLNSEADDFDTGYVTKHTTGMDSGGSSHFAHFFDPPKIIPGPCIIKEQVDASSNNSDISGGFDGYLVTN